MRQSLILAGDFETITNPDDCRVWVWGAANVMTARFDDDVEYGFDIESFIKWVSRENSIMFFHNLKFDGTFILDWLLKNGYVHTDEKKIGKGEFSSLISNMGSYYSITVVWSNGRRTEFRDSYKKLPFKLARIADAWKLEIKKGDIDYHAPRPVGYRPTRDEMEYLFNDVLILCQALKTQLDTGMNKLTVGSDALTEYKKILGKKLYDKWFPVLPESMDTEIRRAYRGGFVIADTRTKGQRVKGGRVYDVNSLYPSVMYKSVLPYGEPLYVPGYVEPTERHPLAIQSVTFTAKLKKDHVPCIQVKGSSHFINTEYQTHIKEPVTLMCTHVDLELWESHYDMDIHSYNGGWLFMGAVGMFEEYIDKWMEVKTKETGALRELAKLFLNSLYGKFATNPNITSKYPILEDDRVKLVLGEEETRDPVYTAMGVFITAYARNITIRAAQTHYSSFLYADTDSLHLAVDADPETLDIHPHRLGAWKFEYEFDDAIFLRAKQYAEHLPPHEVIRMTKPGDEPINDTVVHIAGMGDNIASKLTLDDIVPGNSFGGSLRPVNVPGGVVLIDRDFTLKA